MDDPRRLDGGKDVNVSISGERCGMEEKRQHFSALFLCFSFQITHLQEATLQVWPMSVRPTELGSVETWQEVSSSPEDLLK
jgi:hypothetical protein